MRVLIVATGVCVACGPEKIPGEPPIKFIEVDPDSVKVSLEKGAELEAVADLSVFEGLEPDICPDGAEEALGSADTWKEERRHVTYAEYLRPNARLRVYRELYSTDSEAGLVCWLVAYPASMSVDSLFSKKLAEHVPNDVESMTVYIKTADERSFLTVRASRNIVQEVAWLKP